MGKASAGKAMAAGAVVGLGMWATARTLKRVVPRVAAASAAPKWLGFAALLPGTPGTVARVAIGVLRARGMYRGR